MGPDEGRKEGIMPGNRVHLWLAPAHPARRVSARARRASLSDTATDGNLSLCTPTPPERESGRPGGRAARDLLLLVKNGKQ